MKKILSLLLATALSLSLTACSTSQTPEQVVSAGLDAFKAMDTEKISLYFENSSELTFTDELDETTKAPYALLLKRLSYTIQESKVEKEAATVTVDITNLDYQQTIHEYISQGLALAMEEMSKPQEEQMSQEEVMDTLQTLLLDLLGAEDAATITQTATVTLHKNEAGWQMVFDASLADALTGGLLTALEQIQGLL